MAEAVQQQMEQMIPELEDFERKGLFTKLEIKSIMKKRSHFEYALRRRITQKIDYLRYIQYELNLDTLRRERKKRLKITRNNSVSDHSITKRIHFLFHRAIKKFKSDFKLWVEYFEFCKKSSSLKLLGKAYAMALQSHPSEANLWILAAKHEFEDNSNIVAARILLQRGLRMNPTSELLWREYFRLELLFAEKIRARRALLFMDTNDTKKSSATMTTTATATKLNNSNDENDDDIDDEIEGDDEESGGGVNLPKLSTESNINGPLISDPRLAATTKTAAGGLGEFVSFSNQNKQENGNDNNDDDEEDVLLHSSDNKSKNKSGEDNKGDSLSLIINNSIPQIIFENAIKAIPDNIQFRLSFIEIYQLFENTEEGIQKIYSSLLRDMSTNALTWRYLAERCLLPQTQLLAEQMSPTVVQRLQSTYPMFDTAFIHSLATFEKGLSTDSINLSEIYSNYVQFIFEYISQQLQFHSSADEESNSNSSSSSSSRHNISTAVESIFNYFLSVCSAAAESSKASTLLFKTWSICLLSFGRIDETLSVLQKSVALNSSSVEAWIDYLSFYIRTLSVSNSDVASAIEREFMKAISSVSKENHNEIYQLWINSLSLLGLESEVEKVFRLGLRTIRPGSSDFAILYIKWSCAQSGIAKARQVADFLISPHLSWTPPVSVYNFIISLELTQPIRDSSRIKSLFDAGTRVHGPFDADIWINAMDFARSEGNSQRVTELYWKALKVLRNKRNEFISKHNMSAIQQ